MRWILVSAHHEVMTRQSRWGVDEIGLVVAISTFLSLSSRGVWMVDTFSTLTTEGGKKQVHE